MLKHILFKIAFLIIVLHTIIPHPHADELTNQEHLQLHKNSKSIIGILKFVFHESNDENLDHLIYAHYGNIQKQNVSSQKHQVSIYLKMTAAVSTCQSTNILQKNVRSFKQIVFISGNGLRAPPSTT